MHSSKKQTNQPPYLLCKIYIYNYFRFMDSHLLTKPTTRMWPQVHPNRGSVLKKFLQLHEEVYIKIPLYHDKVDSKVPYMDVSKNSGTPKSSILIGFSIIYHPFWGTTIFGNIHIMIKLIQKSLIFKFLHPPCYQLKASQSSFWQSQGTRTARQAKMYCLTTTHRPGFNFWLRAPYPWGSFL